MMKSSSPVIVLDTHAVLAYLKHEPGGRAVEDILSSARAKRCRILVSSMSVCELAYIVERRRGVRAVAETIALLDELPLEVVDLDRRAILRAASIKARHLVSLGDSFVVALAVDHRATVITGDPEFKRVEHLVAVRWLAQQDSGPAER